MNKVRRKAIANIVSELERIKGILEETKDDEQYSYDSIPENLLGSERADISEEAIDTMDEAIDSLEEIIDTLEDLT